MALVLLNQAINTSVALPIFKQQPLCWLMIKVIQGSVRLGKSKAEVEVSMPSGGTPLYDGFPLALTDNPPVFTGWWMGDLWVIASVVPSAFAMVITTIPPVELPVRGIG